MLTCPWLLIMSTDITMEIKLSSVTPVQENKAHPGCNKCSFIRRLLRILSAPGA